MGTVTLPKTRGSARFFRVLFSRRFTVFGIAVILILIVTAIFAPLIAPYDPYKQNLSQALAEPSWEHVLGTDALGRDTLSRIIYGSITTLLVGVVAIGFATLLGMTLGLIAGYFGGIWHHIIMRIMDGLMVFPTILLALTVSAMLGGGIQNVIIAIGVSLVPIYARVMCGQVLSVKQNDYIMALRSLGASNLRTMAFHVVPNCFPPLIVLMTMNLGMAVLSEAGLSFLGIGIKPPGAAWGAMVNDGYQYLLTRPVLAFAPGLAIMLVVFAFNMLGDGLRDTLDPRLRGTL